LINCGGCKKAFSIEDIQKHMCEKRERKMFIAQIEELKKEN
jgi:hypothetical protein